MRARTVVLTALGLAFVLAALVLRRSGVAQPPAPPAARRRRPRPRVFVLSAMAIAAIAISLVGLGTWRLTSAHQPNASQSVRRAVTPTAPGPPAAPPGAAAAAPTTPAPRSEWRLLAGGDVLMDRTEAAGINPFARVAPPLASADLAAVNVEMAIADGGVAERKTFVFRAPPSAARTMAAAGIDVGNLGNNHALDYGVNALAETIASLRAAGVAPIGAGANEEEAYAPASFEIAGVRVAVIGASRVLPTARWAARTGPGLASAYDEGRLIAAVRSARATHEVVIVMIHWGVELAPCPSREQRRLGSALLDAGASVVLGSHPHVLQPVVLRNGGLIAYSLGNFVWHPRSGATGETGVLEVRLQGAQVSGYRFFPHVLDGRGAPVPAAPATAARIQAAVSNPCA